MVLSETIQRGTQFEDKAPCSYTTPCCSARVVHHICRALNMLKANGFVVDALKTKCIKVVAFAARQLASPELTLTGAQTVPA